MCAMRCGRFMIAGRRGEAAGRLIPPVGMGGLWGRVMRNGDRSTAFAGLLFAFGFSGAGGAGLFGCG